MAKEVNNNNPGLDRIYATKHNRLLSQRIETYWDNRAESYSNLRQKDLLGSNFHIWTEELKEHIPNDRILNVLDIGTATGYIAIAAASLGHKVTGIDISEEMITCAEQTAQELEYDIKFIKMDAHRLSFPPDFFDVIIMRNTSWTLINVRQVYEECYRVLRPEGIFLIYDADYGTNTFYSKGMEKEDPWKASLYQESDAIKEELSISYVQRPQWDLAILRDCGFVHCECNTFISQKFKPHSSIKGRSKFQMFSIYALKASDISGNTALGIEHFFREHLYLRKREERFYQILFQRYNIPDNHFYVLSLLYYHNEGLRPSDISDYLLIPRQTITRVIASLTKQNYVYAKANTKDGRSFVLYLTETGKVYIESILEKFRNLWSSVNHHFPNNELEAFHSLYARLLDLITDEGSKGRE